MSEDFESFSLEPEDKKNTAKNTKTKKIKSSEKDRDTVLQTEKASGKYIMSERINIALMSLILAACVITMIFSVLNFVNLRKMSDVQRAVYVTGNSAPAANSGLVVVPGNSDEANGDVFGVTSVETTTSSQVRIYFPQEQKPQNQNNGSPVNEGSTKAQMSANPPEATQNVQTSAAVTVTEQQKPQQSTELININTATAEQLTVLSGIGEKKARAIVDYRNEYGKFYSKEEITNVSGIGEKTYEKIRDYITVN